MDEVILRGDEIANGLLPRRRGCDLEDLVLCAIHGCSANGRRLTTFGQYPDGVRSEKVVDLLRHERVDVAAVRPRVRLPAPIVAWEVGEQLPAIGDHPKFSQAPFPPDLNTRQVGSLEQNC